MLCMLELIMGKGRQVHVCMQVMDMDVTVTVLRLAIALVHACRVRTQESSSFS